MKRYDHLEEMMCKELDKLDKKYGEGSAPEMSVQDAEKIDLLYHALKSAATYYAMKDADGWEDKDASGRSYRRGRDSMGRYVSRDMDGYSGHYPPMYERYPSYDYGGWR